MKKFKLLLRHNILAFSEVQTKILWSYSRGSKKKENDWLGVFFWSKTVRVIMSWSHYRSDCKAGCSSLMVGVVPLNLFPCRIIPVLHNVHVKITKHSSNAVFPSILRRCNSSLFPQLLPESWIATVKRSSLVNLEERKVNVTNK